jgi:adenylate cyclase
MNATPDNTSANPEQIISGLQRQLSECRAERDAAIAERDKTQRRLAECTCERDEACEQQAAAAEVLQVINSSPGDLRLVFGKMLEKATRLCEAAFGVLRTWDGEHFSAAAYHGDPNFAEWAQEREPSSFVPPDDGSPLRRIVLGEEIVRFADALGEEAYTTSPGFRAMVDASGIRSGMVAALRNDAALLGSITVSRREVRPFSDTQVMLLQNFAAQAVIAMENARLISETREALEQQTATAEVLQVINSSPGDLGSVFDAMLEKAMRLCGAAFGSLYVLEGEHLRSVAQRGVPEAYANYRATNPPSSTGVVLAELIERKQPLHVLDMKDHERYRAGYPDARVMVDLAGARTTILVPLVRDESFLGYISVFRQEVRPFTDKQIALLQNFAAQAVIAMENARLLGELRQRTDQVAELNRGLEARVAEQVEELGRVGRLKRFLAPQLAELIVSQGNEKILESHRREIVVVFCDLRGYTAFTETAEPEEVLDFLREYHGTLGPLVSQFEGTLDQFSGDGIMVFFNDPVPIPHPAARAVNMAVAMREAAGELITRWRTRGCELGFGVGIAWGYATLGQIGFADRSGYTAIGTVCNLAARLCGEAQDAQILVTGRVAAAIGPSAVLEEVGNLSLKGLSRPVAAFNVGRSTSLAEARPHLAIVAGNSGT